MTISIRQLTLFAVVILAVSTVVLTADASDAEITEDGFEYQVADNGSAIIEGYTGNEVAVVIPSTISDESGTHKVVGIDNSAFYGKTMVEIVIPDSIEFIGDSAFANCQNLMFVTLQSTPMFGHNVFMLSSNLILMELSRSITLQDNIFNYGSSNFRVLVVWSDT